MTNSSVESSGGYGWNLITMSDQRPILAPSEPVHQSETESRFPLSPMEQGMLLHHLQNPTSGVDLEQIVCSLSETVDVDALETAFGLAVTRHPNFRTAFLWDSLEEPLHEVRERVSLPITVLDWSDITGAEQQVKLTAFLASDREAGFDFSAPPLARVMIVKTGDGAAKVVFSFHHILMDGRSFPAVLDEIFSAYDELRAGRDWSAPLPRPYSDFIAWQRRKDRSRDETFWRTELSGFAATTSLPESHSDQVGRGERSVTLPVGLTDSLRELANRHGLTLNTIVQGAWALLLSRYTGERRVAFGATRACRRGTVEGADDIVGVFVNTLPVLTEVPPESKVVEWLKGLREQQLRIREFEHTPLVDIMGCADLAPGGVLFDSLLVFDHQVLNSAMTALGGRYANRRFVLHERTSYPITLYAYAEKDLYLRLSYERARFSDRRIAEVASTFGALLCEMVAKAEQTLASISSLSAKQREQLLFANNDTAADYPRDRCVHQLIEQRVRACPDATALVFRGEEVSYLDLDQRANRLAHYLIGRGLGREGLVGLCLERSIDMVVAVLAVLKAGGAYVPLDPGYPPERLAFMLDDSAAPFLLTEDSLCDLIPGAHQGLIVLDAEREAIATQSSDPPVCSAVASGLAYVLYTSGSTGKPKGVMVEHRNVVNFFAGMDRLMGSDGGVWLSVTSLSFDISVLELFWTLARGFKVVLRAESVARRATAFAAPRSARAVDFSLFYFASDERGLGREKYRLLLDGAKFADRNGFVAVWTPERHFHEFGGLYPNPSVVSAAIAAQTENVQIRSGSIVLPLHHPARVAEEWAVVDNLSNGRVGLSVASGWQPSDFVLAPESYDDRKHVMMRNLETVRRLWRGEAVPFTNARGDEVEIRTLPRPVQPELPVWITAAGSEETYRLAGEAGANLLTHLLGQTVAELKAKIVTYRSAYRERTGGEGHVTLMLHTMVGESDDAVKGLVRDPMKDYLRSAVSLVGRYADAWSAFSRKAKNAARPIGSEFDNLTAEEMDALLEFSFERYFETSGLFGSLATCQKMVQRVREVGVDEIACLIDYGVPSQVVIDGLASLRELRAVVAEADEAADVSFEVATSSAPVGFTDEVERYGVTHLQCTPALARLLAASEDDRRGLSRLKKLIVGGEAFPAPLARDLRELVDGEVLNMYGPTETTVWSSAQVVKEFDAGVPIGTPIVNTQLYVVDSQLEPVPPGATGELVIGGDGVTRGYLGRPELTRERFVPDRFRGGSGRLYRTGDLARYHNDGRTVEFVGRLDGQIKIRGHRVELGEIEAVLAEHVDVREAAVVLRGDPAEQSTLVGYIVAEAGAGCADRELREHLGGWLPDYMIPSLFVTLDAFPLTPNGKVDRRALPVPEMTQRIVDAPFATPESDLEGIVASAWREVLNIDGVGIDDNFFDLGGHSLLTIQVMNRLKSVLGRDVPITDLFRFPTIRALARHLGGERSAPAGKGKARAEVRRASRRRRRGR